MPAETDDPALRELLRKVEEEDRAYEEALAAVDRLVGFPVPAEALPELPAQMQRLNMSWEALPPPAGRGPGAAIRRRAWNALAPALQRQTEFNATLVQVLNGYLERTQLLHERVRDLAGALLHYLQRVLPTADARDRLSSGLATVRAELILEAFDRRLESLGRRLEGLLALRDRLESLSAEVRAVRGVLAGGAPPAPAAAARAAEGAASAVFERRRRGSPEETRERLAPCADLFEGLPPVVDLRCGQGELLELLRERGIAARGVEANASAAAEARSKGHSVEDGEPLAFLRAQPDGSVGGLFGAGVAEHLLPAALSAALAEAHRVLRPGGLLVLEAANPRSLAGLLEAYNRDPTNERPLHPETLRFLAAAAGFTEVRLELRSPVDPSSRLRGIPAEGLPGRAAEALNENVRRLNQLLYGPMEYALIARR